jgi:IMP cyclohydrolase
MNSKELAENNFREKIQNNPYPGRGIIIGKSDESTWQIIYWIMGRSTNSRNRRFVAENNSLRTEPVDMSLLTDPSLIIYDAMLELPGIYMVSNGDQTRTISDAIKQGNTFEESLMTRDHEPDSPNFTPRISGMLDTRAKNPLVIMSILKASKIDTGFSDRYFFRPSYSQTGFGYGLTTYMGDGNPLPSFIGDPLLLPCTGTTEQILDKYWCALNEENLVSLAIKTISLKDVKSRIIIRNRHQ